MITFKELQNPIKLKEHYIKHTITYQGNEYSLCELSQLLSKENHNEQFETIVNEQLQPKATHKVLVSYDEEQIFTLKVLTSAQMYLLQELVHTGTPKVQTLSEFFYICDYTNERSFVDVIHQLFLKQLFAKVNYDLPFNQEDMEYDSELFPNS